MHNEHSSQKTINIAYNVILDILKCWQLILLITVSLGLIYDTIKSVQYVPLYCSSARFSINTSITANEADGDVGETFTYIFQSNIFKKTIQNELQLEKLDGYYSANTVGNTNALDISAYSTNQQTAYHMMIALKEHYHEVSTFVVGSTNIDLMNEISVPVAPCNEVNHKRNILLLSTVGFILSTGIIGCLSFLKNTIKEKSEIESKLHLHLLGTLPTETKLVSLKGMKRKKAILINQYSTSFRYIESVKRIRSRIERYASKHNSKVFMITSSLENEGKSSVTVNLALSLAENAHKVLLIDGDFRKPSLHLILEIKEGNGIQALIKKEKSFEECIIQYNDHLDCLYGFEAMENVQDQLAKGLLDEMINQLKDQYDYILIDSAPSRFLSDSSIISECTDGIVLVVKQNLANVSTILRTIDRLSLSKAPIIGCIDNQTFSGHIAGNGYYGYGRYGYSHYYHKRKGKE